LQKQYSGLRLEKSEVALENLVVPYFFCCCGDAVGRVPVSVQVGCGFYV
jgi:hypothetical protein